ncbi:hypothetical protein DE146DRAFT_629983 [Phaeosphaeria sp. MPI-PUGE-AT-0046c]|nr:hypothetical protein DE146DRAFT_629983 [Phaeosphaeria sp. MPI-PUGE-AT-0046c]
MDSARRACAVLPSRPRLRVRHLLSLACAADSSAYATGEALNTVCPGLGTCTVHLVAGKLSRRSPCTLRTKEHHRASRVSRLVCLLPQSHLGDATCVVCMSAFLQSGHRLNRGASQKLVTVQAHIGLPSGPDSDSSPSSSHFEILVTPPIDSGRPPCRAAPHGLDKSLVHISGEQESSDRLVLSGIHDLHRRIVAPDSGY